jgi:hypothetical protein
MPVYLSLFHGRKNPNEQLDGWGEQGPIIGPIEVSFTYGNIKLHHGTNWDDWEHMHHYEDMIFLDGIYYGDFEIWSTDDPLIANNSSRIINYAQFKELHNKTMPKKKGQIYDFAGNILGYLTVRKHYKNEIIKERKDFGLFYAHLGNGITVYNAKEEVNGEFKSVAHISDSGNLTWYEFSMPEDIKREIESEAFTMETASRHRT